MHLRPASVAKRFRNFAVDDPFFFLTIILSITFAVIFSWYSILKYYSLNASAFDLGLNANVLWNTLHGQFMFSDLIGGDIMAEHFSPFRLAALPIYYLYPNPASILVFQDVLLSTAVIPLYKIVKKLLNERIEDFKFLGGVPFAISISYELSPFLGGLYSFDYHMLAFLPFFLFMTIYCFLYNRRVIHIVMIAFIVSLHPNFVYIVALLLIFEVYYSLMHRDKGLIFSSQKSKIRIAASVVILILILYWYLVFSSYVRGFISGSPAFSLNPISEGVGSPPPGSILGLIRYLFKDPSVLFSYFYSNFSAKEQYVWLLFSTTGYLSFLFPETLIIGIPYFLFAMLSTDYAYYGLGYQYNAMIFPVVYVAVAFGVARVINAISRGFDRNKDVPKENARKTRRSVLKYVTILLAAIIIFSSLSGFPYDPIAPPQIFIPSNAMSNIGQQKITGETTFLIEMTHKIPENAYILVQNNLAPFFSDFRHIYMTPYSIGSNTSQWKIFDYLVFTYNVGWADIGEPNMMTVAAFEIENHLMGVYAEYGNSLLILKKGYNSSMPEYYVKSSTIYNASDFSNFMNYAPIKGQVIQHATGGLQTSLGLISLKTPLISFSPLKQQRNMFRW